MAPARPPARPPACPPRRPPACPPRRPPAPLTKLQNFAAVQGELHTDRSRRSASAHMQGAEIWDLVVFVLCVCAYVLYHLWYFRKGSSVRCGRYRRVPLWSVTRLNR